MNLKRFEPFFISAKRTIVKKIKNNQDAEDIFQDIIIYLWSKPETEITHPKTFLYNAVNWYISKYKFNNDLNIDDIDDNMQNFNRVILNSEIGWNIYEIEDSFYSRLKTCPKKYIDPLVYHIIEGMSIKEISCKMSMNQNTVKTNIKRAKEYLKK